MTDTIAAVTASRRHIDFQHRPTPRATPGHAVVRMHTVTLCGTDAHIWDDDYASELPLIQGHEASGVIAELHADDEDADTGSDWTVGDPVVILPMFWCGTCHACSIGRVNACRRMSVYGCYEDGSLVTEQLVPLDHLYRVPDGVDLGLAALVEPISIAMQACRRGQPVAGERVVVAGAGPIGVLAALYLKEQGCDVTVTDTQDGRLELARRFGAHRTMKVQGSFPNAEQREVLDELTGGDGPSLVIDATGVPASVAAGIDLVATAGRVVCVGISEAELSFSMRRLPTKEIDLLGSRNSENLFPECLELLARHQRTMATLITHRYHFQDLDVAFRTLVDPSAGAGKIAIDFPDLSERDGRSES